MNPQFMTIRFGYEIVQSLDFIIKYYSKGVSLSKSEKRINILKRAR